MRRTLETMTAVWVLIGVVVLAGALTVMLQSPVLAQGPTPTPTPGPNDRFGLNNVCSWMIWDRYKQQGRENPEGDMDIRYQQARDADVGWTRWVFEWSRVESLEGSYDFSSMDLVVEKDIKNGLHILAILKNTPVWAQDPNCPQKGDEGCPPVLYTDIPTKTKPIAVFLNSQGNPTDIIAQAVDINPANSWAKFVREIVNQYKPDGVLAGRHPEWPAGAGIRHWEIWNEPDGLEWTGAGGDVDEFYRLLQVAYLTIHHTDPEAKVVLPALAERPDNYRFPTQCH